MSNTRTIVTLNSINNETEVSTLSRTSNIENPVFPGTPLNVGNINPDALYHQEFIGRRIERGILDQTIDRQTIDTISSTQIEISSNQITNSQDAAIFIRDVYARYFNHSRLNEGSNIITYIQEETTEIEENSDNYNILIESFGNIHVQSVRDAILLIRNQEFRNIEALRNSMYERLNNVQFNQEQILPLTISNNSESLVINNSDNFFVNIFRFLGDNFIDFCINILNTGNHGSRIILLALLIKLLSFGIIKLRFFRSLNSMNLSNMLSFFSRQLNIARLRPSVVNIQNIIEMTTETIGRIQESVNESINTINNNRRPNLISNNFLFSLFNSNNFWRYVIVFTSTGLIGLGIFHRYPTNRQITNGSPINVNITNNSTTGFETIIETAKLVKETFKEILKELLKKIKK